MPGTERKRAEIAIKIADDWRKREDIYYGYVMVYQGKFFEFCEELPEYPNRKNFPTAVCVDNTVLVKTGIEKRWDNIYVNRRTGAIDKDPIDKIAKDELMFCYPESKNAISEWFSGRTVCEKSTKMRRFEYYTLGQIFSVIQSGVSIDRFLTGRMAS